MEPEITSTYNFVSFPFLLFIFAFAKPEKDLFGRKTLVCYHGAKLARGVRTHLMFFTYGHFTTKVTF